MKHLTLPLAKEEIAALRAGEEVTLSGRMLVARDAAHKRMTEALARGEELPVSVAGETVYYMGPSPAREGRVIGSAGPTTSTRMDAYTPALLELGLVGMIGKGRRSDAVREAIVRNGAVYFATIGGCGALLSRAIVGAETLAYPDLGAEALLRITVRDFPCFVAIDTQGNQLYK